MLIATVLRTLNLGDIDFVHDELSALSRTGYQHFTELISKGVLTDTHPPLVQILLNYWVRLFGTGEAIVKLPFIIAGLAGIWLVWLLGKSWFSKQTALAAMAYLACSEYVIDYHQQARPYAAGFFLCLLAIWAFTRYFMGQSPGKIKFLFLYALSLALAALTHHLALMMMALFAACSLLLIQPKQLKPWLFAHLGGLVLYLPNIGILLSQFEQKGVGEWLGKPGWHSFYYIASWFTHYSSFCALAIALPAIPGLLFGWKQASSGKKKIVLLILIAGCVFIPFFYSIYVNPIFQFSSLFFILPLLLLFIFSGLNDAGRYWIVPLVILIFTGGSFILKRNYYTIAAHQPVAEMCRQSIAFFKGHEGKKSLACLNAEAWFITFYQKKYNYTFPFVTWYNRNFHGKELKELIENKRPDYILLAWMPQLAIPIAQQDFKCVLTHKQSPQLDFYALGNSASCNQEKIIYESRLFPYRQTGFWEHRPERISQTDSTQQLIFNEQDEFGIAFEAPLSAFPINRHSILQCEAVLTPPFRGRLNLTATITRDGSAEPLLYISEDADLQTEGSESNPVNLYLRTRVVDVFRENQQLAGCKLKVYIWNKEKINLKVSQISIKWLEGNPEMYSLYE